MNKYFKPKKVYRCTCLRHAIARCLLNQTYCFDTICNTIETMSFGKIYCVTCGPKREDLVFCCGDHVAMLMLAMNTNNDETVGSIYFKNYLKYIKKYLRKKYYYFPFDNFNN